MKTLKLISQALIIMLALDAGWIALGLYRNKVMWAWIVTYWVALTIKNIVDYMASKPINKPNLWEEEE